MDKPKTRHIKLDVHTLAYLGDFVLTFEKAVQQKIRNTLSNIKSHNQESKQSFQ